MSALRKRFDSGWMPEPNSGCWLWTAGAQYGRKNTDLRPRISLGAGKSGYAYRVSWELHCGPIPEGMEVCHRCDVPLCVNPAHLFVGTRRDNMQDCVRKGRTNKPKGERTARAKLTAVDIRVIRSSARPSKALAREYGVNDRTIRSARKGMTWRHVA